MSTQELKPGGRVRLRVDCPDQGYRAGARGAVWGGPHPTPGGGRHYYVTMDEAGPDGTPVGFAEDQIEPDV